MAFSVRCFSFVDLFSSLFQDKSFHVSILWCVGDKKCILDAKIAEFQLELEQLLATEIDDFRLDVRQIKCQSGNKSFVIDLPSKT